MTVLDETFTLNNGHTIPKLGFGTWLIDDAAVVKAVQDAAAAGYRHFDTAQAYDNEHGVGVGLRATGIRREDLFITSKIQAELKDYASAKKSIDESLHRLNMDYLDLMLIHSPQPWAEFHGDNHYFEGNLAVWQAMEDAVKEGKLCSIGVSNFQQADLDNILQHSATRPAVNQLLVHIANIPFKALTRESLPEGAVPMENTRFDLINYTQQQHILVEAYSPIGHGEVLRDPKLQDMAAQYHVSTAQLCIRYCLQLGTLPLPKSANAAHIRSNAQIDFQISAPDMETLKQFKHIPNYGASSHFPVYSGK